MISKTHCEMNCEGERDSQLLAEVCVIIEREQYEMDKCKLGAERVRPYLPGHAA